MITATLIGPSDWDDGKGNSRSNNGLGNQMFCVAAAESLALDNNDVAAYSCLKSSGTKSYGTNVFRNLKYIDNEDFVTKDYQSPHDGSFSEPYSPIPYESGLKLVGYFQSEKYFKHNKDYILDLFKMPGHVRRSLMSRHFSLFNKKTVSLHLRRGDRLRLDWEPNLSYYKRALDLFSKEDYNFLVFSDEIDWCKKNMEYKDKYPITFIENQKDYEDMYLMSLCDNNIITDSTFSWWAAYLNRKSDKKIIGGAFREERGAHEKFEDIVSIWV